MTLYYYSKSKQLLKARSDDDAHWLRLESDKRPDYLILLMNSDLRHVSFIEVFDEDVFKCRCFSRNGSLVFLRSFEADRSKCEYIRQRLTANIISIDFAKLNRDKYWGKITYEQPANVRDYLLPLPKPATMKPNHNHLK